MAAASLSFGRDRRLLRTADFARVKTEGATQRGRFLLLGSLALGSTDMTRAGFVTSKRVGAANVRNRVRRRLREAVRLHQKQLRPGFWIVLVARPAAATATFQELKDEWLRLADRASILAP